ncbi:hypothetical protein RIF29_21291 [Crotalaria pallida]|uniref:Ubiquitin-like domain-containing protein n=1 Tax=Crotalaria pallida TaxID=3830 RepID=A0AAN9F763_CROPI
MIRMVSILLENDQKIAEHDKSHPVLQSQQRQPSFEPAGHATPSSNDGISISQSQQPQYYYSQPMQQPKSSLLQTNYVAPSSPLKHGFMRRVGMHISVRRFHGNNFMLEVARSDTVHNVKAMIMAKIGIPIHQQRIIYQGKDLEDGCTLADYNMLNESTVHLILRNPTQGQPFGPEGHATPSSNDGIPISQSQQPQYYYSQPMQQPKSSLLQTNYAAPSSPLKHGFMRRDGMHISVRRFDGNEFMLEVARSDTVHDVKAMIMAKIGIPVHQQLIIYQGKNLEDGFTLADYVTS